MRAVVQRVSGASVTVNENGCAVTVGQIDQGILIYLGVGLDDDLKDVAYLADKAANLRIFMDSEEKMNLSACDLEYPALVVSQFTLYADARKGRRPSFSGAAGNEAALGLYESFCRNLSEKGIHVERGAFGRIMKVAYTNEGPITILLDSKKQF
ncbi:MAG: D-tyrosyl-tRNA(Tyr) deacylase [Spirochaetaceae bacterium]|nr:D-tyrosyl-tRNA(Tyr) deacylase [Spirochaetaceae bacterium]